MHPIGPPSRRNSLVNEGSSPDDDGLSWTDEDDTGVSQGEELAFEFEVKAATFLELTHSIEEKGFDLKKISEENGEEKDAVYHNGKLVGYLSEKECLIYNPPDIDLLKAFFSAHSEQELKVKQCPSLSEATKLISSAKLSNVTLMFTAQALQTMKDAFKEDNQSLSSAELERRFNNQLAFMKIEIAVPEQSRTSFEARRPGM